MWVRKVYKVAHKTREQQRKSIYFFGLFLERGEFGEGGIQFPADASETLLLG